MKFRDSVHQFDTWGIYFSKIYRPVLSPLKEIELIINSVIANKENIVVLSSGGLDSEIIIHLFSKKIPITVLSFEFIFQGNVINSHDLAYLDCIAGLKNVKIITKIIDLDL